MNRTQRLIRTARTEAGLSQRELAAAAHTSGPAVAAYESGSKEPRAGTLARILDAAGAELVAVPARSRNERFMDLVCARLAEMVLERPELLEEAKAALGRIEHRSSWSDAWRHILDAGPVVAAAVLTSPAPDARPLKADCPVALVARLSDAERTGILESARAA